MARLVCVDKKATETNKKKNNQNVQYAKPWHGLATTAKVHSRFHLCISMQNVSLLFPYN